MVSAENVVVGAPPQPLISTLFFFTLIGAGFDLHGNLRYLPGIDTDRLDSMTPPQPPPLLPLTPANFYSAQGN